MNTIVDREGHDLMKPVYIIMLILMMMKIIARVATQIILMSVFISERFGPHWPFSTAVILKLPLKIFGQKDILRNKENKK